MFSKSFTYAAECNVAVSFNSIKARKSLLEDMIITIAAVVNIEYSRFLRVVRYMFPCNCLLTFPAKVPNNKRYCRNNV